MRAGISPTDMALGRDDLRGQRDAIGLAAGFGALHRAHHKREFTIKENNEQSYYITLVLQ
jgi:hypothetical protein